MSTDERSTEERWSHSTSLPELWRTPGERLDPNVPLHGRRWRSANQSTPRARHGRHATRSRRREAARALGSRLVEEDVEVLDCAGPPSHAAQHPSHFMDVHPSGFTRVSELVDVNSSTRGSGVPRLRAGRSPVRSLSVTSQRPARCAAAARIEPPYWRVRLPHPTSVHERHDGLPTGHEARIPGKGREQPPPGDSRAVYVNSGPDQPSPNLPEIVRAPRTGPRVR